MEGGDIGSLSDGNVKWEVIQGSVLVYHNPHMDVFWEMPSGYSLPAEVLLNLAEWLLLKGFGIDVPLEGGARNPGRRVGLAYSGGVDSTAAFELLPDPVAIYTEVASPGRVHKIENALLALDEVSGISIRTNADELAKKYGKSRGFYGTGGFTVPLVLLADYFDFGVVADGNVLETAYLHSRSGHGTKYQKKNYSAVFERFRTAGLEYCMPCAGLTEVCTTELASGYRYAMGCMRGEGGQPCDSCAKCFRKRALQGNPIPPNPESEAKMTRELVPMLPSLLWAVEKHGLRHPLLSSIEKDIQWVDKWYEDSEQFIPMILRPFVRRRLEERGIDALIDDSAIKDWVSSR